ncbi:uncharacterized protein METZ01_LOCUS115198 [marine metagenome]|uniref:Uncharacterized protein n=1 Tax=marine metagenome TaxID=408172 RepID=A0A381XC99_9ZZZZ
MIFDLILFCFLIVNKTSIIIINTLYIGIYIK